MRGKYVLGVDLFEPFLQKAHEAGVKVMMGDVLEFLKEMPADDFDVITGFDIIEHLSKEKALETITEAKRVALMAFILGIPLEHRLLAYKPDDENPLQQHRSLWTHEEFLDLGFDRVILFKDYHYRDGERFDAALCLWLKDKSQLDRLIELEVV